jgi:type II secretory pathway pseudopilin PulG
MDSMYKSSLKSQKKQMVGFTLVELAIVTVIVGFLLSMFLIPLSSQLELRARAETQVLLNQAQETLIGYAVVNRHLPCPDTDAIPDGVENRNAGGNCVSDEGILPWNTLGIERVDAWNHYFKYRVDATFSNSVTLFTLANAEGATGIQINGDGGAALVSTNSRPVAVVLSHGANGFGAINMIQASPANRQPAPASAEEIENTNLNTTFVSRVPTNRGSPNEFDDMLIWISPKLLINRMITAGRLP